MSLLSRLSKLFRRQPKVEAKPISPPEVVAPKLKVSPWARVASQLSARQEVAQDNVLHFKPAVHPPGATPPKDRQLAMDDSTNWAAGVLNGVASEGLLFLGYPYLSELAQRPEYRVMSETIATEMTREWIEIKSKSHEDSKTEKIKELEAEFERLNVRDCFKELAIQDGFFGRSHLFIDLSERDDSLDTDDLELKTPIGDGLSELSRTKVKKGKLRRLKTIEAVWTYPTTYNAVNPLRDDWYKPMVWYVMGKEIHATRLLTFIGHPVPDLLKPAYSFGGLSLSQLAKPYVDIWLTTRESVGKLIHSFSVMVLKTDLETILQDAGSIGGLLERVNAFNLLRDNQGTFVINNGSEDFANVSASLAGLHELQAQSQEHMMSVVRIPAVKFTGISPSGLNASSEGEIRAFYDTIHATQEAFFRPNLTKIFHFAQLNIWGKVDEDLTFDFVPLWSLTEKEQAELRHLDAQTGQILVDTGAVSQAEERARVASDPDSPYDGLDVEDLPDLGGEELGGLEPQGGRPQPAAQEQEEQDLGGNDLALDDGQFNEADHPRDKDGKFTAGGGGVSNYEAYGLKTDPQEKDNQYGELLVSQGFGLVSSGNNDGTVTWASWKGNGVKVTKDPNTGEWTWSNGSGDSYKGLGKKSLEAWIKHGVLINGANKEGEAPKTPTETGAKKEEKTSGGFASQLEVANLAKTHGFQISIEKSNPSAVVLTNSLGATLSLKDSKWTLSTPGHTAKMGEGKEALEALLTGGDWQSKGVKNYVPGPGIPEPPSQSQQSSSLPHEETLKTIAKVRPKPTNEEDNAISSYKGAGYRSINERLRETGEHTEKSQKLHDWLERAELPEDVTLYRGISGAYANVLKSIIDEGTEFRDRGFISTSTNNHFSKGWAGSSGSLLMTIKAKKGQKGAAIAGLGSAGNVTDGEYEVLLQSDSKLRVVSFDWQKGTVECELIQGAVANGNKPYGEKPAPPTPAPASPQTATKPIVASAPAPTQAQPITAKGGSTAYKKNPAKYKFASKSGVKKKPGSKSAEIWNAIEDGGSVASALKTLNMPASTVFAYLDSFVEAGHLKINEE